MADFQSYFFSLFLIYLITTIFIRVFFRSAHAKSNPPPTPFSLPIIGHLHLLGANRHQFFHKLSLQYGPVFRLYIGSVPCVVASSPETAKEFLKTNEIACLDRPQSSAITYLTYGEKDFAFIPYGSLWRFMKKIVTSQLINGTTLDLHRSLRHDEINRFMNSLSQKAKVGKAVDVGKELVMTTNNIISRMIMSERCSDEENNAREIRTLVAEINEITDEFNLSDCIWFFKKLDLQGYGKRLKDIRSRVDVIIDRIMEEHEDETKQKARQVKDLLSILLDISKDKSMEIELDKENIKALIMNIFTAATDNTAITIEWALGELINHPNIMKKATEEIDRVIGKKRLLQESDIENLPYLQAIVKETLRLHPVVPLIPRQSREDCKVAGYYIPAKTSILINMWAVGRDPNIWENPAAFRPERFKDNRLDVRGQHFHLLPFGSGRRMCPGISLAMNVIHVTLGSMIQCFEWKAGKDGNDSSVDMDEALSLTLGRANPLVCIPVARLDSIPSSM